MSDHRRPGIVSAVVVGVGGIGVLLVFVLADSDRVRKTDPARRMG